jgi:hypothetical protein
MKITREMIEASEFDEIFDYLCEGGINDVELGESVKKALESLPDSRNRGTVLDGSLIKCYFLGGFSNLGDDEIRVSHDQITVYLPEEYDPETGVEGLKEFYDDDVASDLCVEDNGTSATLYTGYGAAIKVDIAGLNESVEFYS